VADPTSSELAAAVRVERAPTLALDVETLYAILRLRAEVFVVEQACPFNDLDGRDLEPDSEQWWIADHGRIVAVLRTLAEPDGTWRVGRVVVAPTHRGRGLAAVLMRAVHEWAAGQPLVLDAQAHLADWYGRLGYERSGPDFVEDDIPHTPMRRGLDADTEGSTAAGR
jgi:ElaA protein